MKKLLSVAIAMVLVISTSFVAFAGTWEKDAVGYKWNNGDGTYASAGWKWVDDNGDSKYECYYFDNDGHCLLGTTTPDGYIVNTNGAWTVNDIVQIATEIGPSMSANDEATAKNNRESTSLDSYISKLSFTTPEAFEKSSLHSNGKGNICVDLYLPANAKSMDYTEAMGLLSQSAGTLGTIANNALKFFNNSVDVVATMYTADGNVVVSRTYYGCP